MRLHILVIVFFQFIFAAAAVIENAGQAAENDIRGLQPGVPQCAQQCFSTLTCMSDVSTCYCSDEALLAVETCAWSNCTVRESLVAKQTHRSACSIPERTYSWSLLILIWFLFGLSVLAVMLRFIARSQISSDVGLGWEDWVVLTCLAPLMLYDILLDLGVEGGLGKDIWTLRPAQINVVLRNLWIANFAYTSILVGVQISIILFYMRIFGDAHRNFRNICIAIIALCICSGLAACIGSLFYCSHISLFWQGWDNEQTGTCRTAHIQIYTMAGVNIFTDLVILTLPIPKLRNLNVSTARKVGLGATFLIGIITTCASIIRLRYIVVWGNTSNATWDYNRVAIVSSYECHLSIICACMPSMAGLWKRFSKRKTVSELKRSRFTARVASSSKEALYEGAEDIPQRQRERGKSAVRIATSLAEFLATKDCLDNTELELTQRGIDHANAEIERFKTSE